MAVPKTAMHENRAPLADVGDVGIARQILAVQPIGRRETPQRARTASSGVVSRDFTARMVAERFAGSSPLTPPRAASRRAARAPANAPRCAARRERQRRRPSSDRPRYNFRQNIVVGKPHQPRRLARRNKARAHPIFFDDQHELPARSASGRAQAAGYIVEARLGPLDFFAGGSIAGAPVGRADHFAAGVFRLRDSRKIYLAHFGDQPRGLLARMPGDSRGLILDDFGQGEVALWRRGDAPPAPFHARLCAQMRVSGEQPRRVKRRGRPLHRSVPREPGHPRGPRR